MKGNKKYNDETGSNVQVERLKEVSSNRYTVNQKKNNTYWGRKTENSRRGNPRKI